MAGMHSDLSWQFWHTVWKVLEHSRGAAMRPLRSQQRQTWYVLRTRAWRWQVDAILSSSNSCSYKINVGRVCTDVRGMGILWSDQGLRESNEKRAYEDLDGLVWDVSKKVSLESVKAALKLHCVQDRYSVEQLYKKFKNLEAEQVGKQNFFHKKKVEDLYVFHATMALRYSNVITHLTLISIESH